MYRSVHGAGRSALGCMGHSGYGAPQPIGQRWETDLDVATSLGFGLGSLMVPLVRVRILDGAIG